MFEFYKSNWKGGKLYNDDFLEDKKLTTEIELDVCKGNFPERKLINSCFVFTWT